MKFKKGFFTLIIVSLLIFCAGCSSISKDDALQEIAVYRNTQNGLSIMRDAISQQDTALNGLITSVNAGEISREDFLINSHNGIVNLYNDVDSLERLDYSLILSYPEDDEIRDYKDSLSEIVELDEEYINILIGFYNISFTGDSTGYENTDAVLNDINSEITAYIDQANNQYQALLDRFGFTEEEIQSKIDELNASENADSI